MADDSFGKGHLLPVYEPFAPPPSCTLQRGGDEGRKPARPRLIYATPIGEATELRQDSECSSDEEEEEEEEADAGRRGCRCTGKRLFTASLTAFVDATETFYKKPRSDLPNDLGRDNDGDGGEDGDGDGGDPDGGDAVDGYGGGSPAAEAQGQIEAGGEHQQRQQQHESSWTALRRLFLVLVWDVIHPDSRFRTTWDVILNLSLLYVALITTFLLCFEFERDRRMPVIVVLDSLVYAIFLADIPLNFRTGLRHGRPQDRSNRWLIAANYLTGWFGVDLVAAIPWGLVTSSLGSYMQLLKLLRLIRLLRLFKVSRVMQRSQLYMNVEQSQGAAMASVVFYVLSAVIVLHLSASAWFFVAVIESNTLEGTWAEPARLEDAGNFERYLTSLYFVVITFTTVGYGDVYPVTTSERVMACIGMLIGVVTLGYIISTANAIAVNSNKYETSKLATLDNAAEFIGAHVRDPRLARHVKRYYRWVTLKQVNDKGDDEMIANMPYGLRYDVLRSVHKQLLDGVLFLRAASQLHEGLVLEICARLRMEHYGRHSHVVDEDGWDTEMYFVTSGRLQVYRSRVLTIPDHLASQRQQPASVVQAPATRGAAVMEMYGKFATPLIATAAAAEASEPMKARETTNADGGGQDEDVAEGLPGGGGGGGGGGSGGEAQPSLPQLHRSMAGSHFNDSRAQTAAEGVSHAGGDEFGSGAIVLTEGQYFGEYSCLTGCPRTATVVAVVMSEVYALKRKHLGAAMSRWPALAEVWKACEEYGAELKRVKLQQTLQGAIPGSAAMWGTATSSRGSVRVPRSTTLSSGEERYQDFKRFLDQHIRGRAGAGAGAGADGGRDAPTAAAPGGARHERAWLGSMSTPPVTSGEL